RHTAGLTGADLANIANEAAISAGRSSRSVINHADFEHAMDRVIAGLQQRRVITDKEKRILAYHEGGHALMAHLMSAVSPVQKATIIARGTALGYTLNLPEEERYLHTKEELVDWMVVTLSGRAAEQVVFGRVTNGAANDLEKVTELARSMVFEYGMGDSAVSRTMRADNYALSEETKRTPVDDLEQAVETYRRLFGAEVEHRETVSDQGADVALLRVGDGRIELLAAHGPDTPVGKFLAERGAGMHHLAFEVDDVGTELARL